MYSYYCMCNPEFYNDSWMQERPNVQNCISKINTTDRTISIEDKEDRNWIVIFAIFAGALVAVISVLIFIIVTIYLCAKRKMSHTQEDSKPKYVPDSPQNTAQKLEVYEEIEIKTNDDPSSEIKPKF